MSVLDKVESDLPPTLDKRCVISTQSWLEGAKTMSKNLLDANNWVNPKLGAICIGALLADMPAEMSCDYRVLNMSARELMEVLNANGALGNGYYTVSLTSDRCWVHVSLDLTIKGHSACSFGYLDNRVQDAGNGSFWSRWNGGRPMLKEATVLED